MANILLIEDNDTMREAMSVILKKLDHNICEVSDGMSGIDMLNSKTFQLVVTDYKMAGMNGIEVLKKVKQKSPDTEVMLITAFGTIELAVDAMKYGAVDFITKPFSQQEFQIKVCSILERVQERQKLRRISEENIYLRDELDVQFNYGEIVGNSPQMKDVYKTIKKVAPTNTSIIIYGKSGTGKELVARAIHKESNRKNCPFIKVNCGALAEGVLESELFGHEKGAFTGAVNRKKGRFELADNGSIFLDEIGDISSAMQLKLLRILQEKEFERVGGEKTITIDVRIIAATNKNLKQEVSNENFREDLYYRLHILPIFLPPLQARTDDIPVLVSHFLNTIGAEIKKTNLSITDAAMKALMEYKWPGNIRELENVLERAAVLCENDIINLADLPLLIDTKDGDNLAGENLDLNRTLEETEKRLIEKALDKSKGIKTETARLLGIKNSALYYKLEKYGLMS